MAGSKHLYLICIAALLTAQTSGCDSPQSSPAVPTPKPLSSAEKLKQEKAELAATAAHNAAVMKAAKLAAAKEKREKAAAAASVEKDKKDLARLKRSFHTNKDFKDNVTYVPECFTQENSWERKHLGVAVASNGQYWLMSHYHASEWLFHQKANVKINGQILETDVVPTYSDHNRTQVADGVVEDVVYDDDHGIVVAIATNYNKPIKVQLEGKQYADEFTMSSGDKTAFRDAYRLATLLKKYGQ